MLVITGPQKHINLQVLLSSLASAAAAIGKIAQISLFA